VTDPGFNMQQALTDLAASIKADLNGVETRVREDVRVVSVTAVANAARAQAVADAAILAAAKIDGRVVALEEKASWASTGIGVLFLAALAFIWRIISGHG
jgi:hypothetical protein